MGIFLALKKKKNKDIFMSCLWLTSLKHIHVGLAECGMSENGGAMQDGRNFIFNGALREEYAGAGFAHLERRNAG